jgi:hypothetical protein
VRNLQRCSGSLGVTNSVNTGVSFWQGTNGFAEFLIFSTQLTEINLFDGTDYVCNDASEVEELKY